jgi:hypothetical protein
MSRTTHYSWAGEILVPHNFTEDASRTNPNS